MTAQYLIVAGGAGGGGNYHTVATGGGGGAGGLLTGTGLAIDANSNYVVVVGAGGAGGTGGAGTNGVNGTNSSFSMVATAAVGGGYGATNQQAGGNGGSGGGASGPTTAGSFAGGTATSGQGNAGGSANQFQGGGGGGAGAVGASGATGNGGNGLASSISGSSVTYAGGGGQTGGTGGGGNAGVAGTANTGGGGGMGAGGANNAGGAGGSGVVIIAYPGSTQQMAGGTVTISGGNVIHTFTSSGYLTPIKYASRSLRFRSSATAYLNRTPLVASNRTTWTWSGWVKRGAQGSQMNLFHAYDGSSSQRADFQFTSGNTLTFYKGGTGTPGQFTSLAVFRDPSAWYHIVLVADYSNATSGNRALLYVNGVAQSLTINTTFDTSNGQINGNWAHQIGGYAGGTYLDGYLTEINFIDGAALTPSSFGTFNSFGVWQPITYGGSYGTNGFYLTFGNNTSTTTLGYDTSPQGNNWTTNNISVTAGATYDSMLDVPTLTSATVANYATLNPLFAGTSSYLSGGNLNASISAANTSVVGTFQIPSTGKWYWEYQVTTIAGGGAPMGGIATTASNSPAVFYRTDGTKIVDGTNTSYGATYTTTDTIGVAVDVGGGTITFYKNNTSQGAITYASSAFYPALRSNAATDVFNINFGQRPFTYTPPSGFVALNTYNLSTPTIPNGAVYMAATTYTGTNTTQSIANTVNGTNFQPDFVWFKSRATTYAHALFDSVRGVTKGIETNSANAELTSTAGNDLAAFTSTGFTVGAPQNWNSPNNSGSNPVAWQWKANGTGVTNTSGSITSTVSANTTAGFSIVTYTGNSTGGATVGHGLGVAPAMIIVKNRSGANYWIVWQQSLTSIGWNLYLNATDSQQNDNQFQAKSSTTFTVSNGASVNVSGNNYVAYCFAAVAGYSAFGSYTGNGSADGPFVFLGFRPRWVMTKRTDSTGSWLVVDSSRNTYNVVNGYLVPNTSDAEGSATWGDFLSNGFKLRGTTHNGSGESYIYAAFAENSFKFANAR